MKNDMYYNDCARHGRMWRRDEGFNHFLENVKNRGLTQKPSYMRCYLVVQNFKFALRKALDDRIVTLF